MTRSIRAAAALMAAACSLAGAGAAQAKTLDVAILGDSYAAGVGGGTYDGTPCRRSPNTWGQVYADAVRAKGTTVNVVNAACGGAVVTDLDAQMAAVTPQTDLVLLQIGGNDAKFADIVAWCFMPLVAGPNNCKNAIEVGESKFATVWGTTIQRLRTLRTKLRRGAKVVLMTYPYLATTSGYLLRTTFASFDSGAAMRRWGDGLDRRLRDAAAAVSSEAGYDYARLVSNKAAFAGHEPEQNPWAENPNRWIHEFTNLPASVDYYHPTAQGYQEIAQVAVAAGGAAGDYGVAQ